MLRRIRQDGLRLLLAVSVVFMLMGTPSITPALAGDCPPPASGNTC